MLVLMVCVDVKTVLYSVAVLVLVTSDLKFTSVFAYDVETSATRVLVDCMNPRHEQAEEYAAKFVHAGAL